MSADAIEAATREFELLVVPSSSLRAHDMEETGATVSGSAHDMASLLVLILNKFKMCGCVECERECAEQIVITAPTVGWETANFRAGSHAPGFLTGEEAPLERLDQVDSKAKVQVWSSCDFSSLSPHLWKGKSPAGCMKAAAAELWEHTPAAKKEAMTELWRHTPAWEHTPPAATEAAAADAAARLDEGRGGTRLVLPSDDPEEWARVREVLESHALWHASSGVELLAALDTVLTKFSATDAEPKVSTFFATVPGADQPRAVEPSRRASAHSMRGSPYIVNKIC
jgi:hypothetical protein